MSAAETDTETEVPLFPLGTVLFPGGLLPLRIFERRYVDMVRRCMRDDTGFGVTLITRGGEVGAPAETAPVATYAKIIDFDQGDDGLLHILARGERKLHITGRRVQDDMLLVGAVRPLAGEPATPLEPRHEGLALLLEQILEQLGEPWDRLDVDYADARDVGCRLAELLPLPAGARLHLLMLEDPLERVESIAALVDAAGAAAEDDSPD